jgi:hypothetical protein
MSASADATVVAAKHVLPSHVLSLEEFVTCWASLEAHDTTASAAILSVVGVLNDGEQVSIDVDKYYEDQIAEAVEDLSVRRNYHSLHGLSRDLPYVVNGVAYVNPPAHLTLIHDNHITVHIVCTITLR